jgi:allantoinase
VRELEHASADGARLIVLNLHPYIVGQPFRIRYLEEALAALVGSRHVWVATLGEIVESYLAPRSA